MDRFALKNLQEAVEGNAAVCRVLLERVRAVGYLLPASEVGFWEMFFLLDSFERGFARAGPALQSGLPQACLFSSALVDSATYGRNLLFSALDEAVRLDLVAGDSDAERFKNDLFRGRDLACGKVEPQPAERMVVAYLDMLRVSESDGELADQFASYGRELSRRAVRAGLSSYYWRSSDTFYILGFGKEHELGSKCHRLFQILLWTQRNLKVAAPDQKEPRRRLDWMWQMGVASGEGCAIGDILLPQSTAKLAAKLMEDAKAPNRKDGGEILFTSDVKDMLDKGSGKRIAGAARSVPGRRIKLRPSQTQSTYWMLAKGFSGDDD